ncbi:MAG TPA: hypothetical protein VF773_17010 [Verrucomicrobiae bacterium]
MRPKLLIPVILIALALFVGFFFGRWQSKRNVDKYLAQASTPEVRRALADFSRAAGVLQALRAGDTNGAIETLESELDTQIMYIGAVTEATPDSARDMQWLSRIRWLKEYRTNIPGKTTPLRTNRSPATCRLSNRTESLNQPST